MNDINEQLLDQTYFNKTVQLSPFYKQLKDTKVKAIFVILFLYLMVFFLGGSKSWFVLGIILISFFAGLLYYGIRRMERMYQLHHATSMQELFNLYREKPQPVITLKPIKLNDVYELRIQVREVINQETQDRLYHELSELTQDSEFVSLLLSLQKTKNTRIIKLKEDSIYHFAKERGIDDGRWYFDVLILSNKDYRAVPIEKLGVSVLYYLKNETL